MKKSFLILGAILSALLLLLTGSGLITSALALGRISKLEESIASSEETDEDVAREDDVVIAQEYTILSTRQISDAYLSGDTGSLTEKEKETLQMASDVLDSIITEGMDDYEKEKAVYEWMVSSLSSDSGLLPVIRDTQEDCDNPYGTLKYHNAVCVGYATTFRLFMQMMEIPCMVIHSSDLIHSWDLVQLEGNWYHTDIYSDAGTGGYSHFNRTDQMQEKDQKWNTDFFPAADCSDYCYAYRNSEAVSDVYRIPEILRSSLDEGTGTFGLRFGLSPEDRELVIAEQILNRVQMTVQSSEQYAEIYFDWSWSEIEEGILLSVVVHSYSGEEDPPEITDEEAEKIDEAIIDAFGEVAPDWPDEPVYDFDGAGEIDSMEDPQ